jgi:COP9 signalosome complex subunit 5
MSLELYEGCDSDEIRDKLAEEAPWKKDPSFFKKVKISALALTKMVLHAESGGDIEVMGLMQGKVREDTFYVLDAFPLPVEGTETRVNAGDSANEFMVSYTETSEQLLSNDYVVGWYHSHPGYGCWLSGIDVATEDLYQQHGEPFIAVVIDPKRTLSNGKTEIGAFRTFDESVAKKSKHDADGSSSQAVVVPQEKIEDFGVHANRYYSLAVEVFKTETDSAMLGALWEETWFETLQASPLEKNMGLFCKEMKDVTKKLDKAVGSYKVGEPAEKGSCLHRCCQQISGISEQTIRATVIELLKRTAFGRKKVAMELD